MEATSRGKELRFLRDISGMEICPTIIETLLAERLRHFCLKNSKIVVLSLEKPLQRWGSPLD